MKYGQFSYAFAPGPGRRVAAGRIRRPGVRLGFLLLCIGLWTCSQVHAQSPAFSEYRVKAVFLLNLANFVAWPAKTFDGPQSFFNIVVLGPNPFARSLDQAVRGETVRGRPIRVKHVADIEELKGETPQILFVGAALEAQWTEIGRTARDRPILTVSDVDGFAHRGGIINLMRQGNRILVEANPAAAKRAGLAISAKLLNLALIVKGPASLE